MYRNETSYFKRHFENDINCYLCQNTLSNGSFLDDFNRIFFVQFLDKIRRQVRRFICSLPEIKIQLSKFLVSRGITEGKISVLL